MRWPLQPLQPFQPTQLQPPFGQSVDSLCHPWFTTTNVSYRFPILKLPPPPRAVLLVMISMICILCTLLSYMSCELPCEWIEFLRVFSPIKAVRNSWRHHILPVLETGRIRDDNPLLGTRFSPKKMPKTLETWKAWRKAPGNTCLSFLGLTISNFLPWHIYFLNMFQAFFCSIFGDAHLVYTQAKT